MQDWLWIVYDVLAVLLVCWFVRHSAYKGFVRSVVELLGYIVSLVVAKLASGPIADFLFEHVVRTPVTNSISNSIVEVGSGGFMQDLQGVIDALPSFVTDLFHFDKEAFLASGTDLIGKSADEVAKRVVDTTIQPAVVMLLQSLLVIVLFSVCIFLIGKLAYLFKFINNIPLVGPVNYILGGALGLIKGCIFLFILALVANTFIVFSQNTWGWLSYEVIDSTYVFRWFFNLNPFLSVKL